LLALCNFNIFAYMSENVYLICIYPGVRQDMKFKCMIRVEIIQSLSKDLKI